jgi:hypothetical protein
MNCGTCVIIGIIQDGEKVHPKRFSLSVWKIVKCSKRNIIYICCLVYLFVKTILHKIKMKIFIPLFDIFTIFFSPSTSTGVDLAPLIFLFEWPFMIKKEITFKLYVLFSAKTTNEK